MGKDKGNSIFRVMVARVRHSTHEQLVKLAKNDTIVNGRQIYVADLVRDAIKCYLKNRSLDEVALNDNENQLTNKN